MPTVFILGFFVKKISAGAKEKFGFYNFKFKEEKTIWIWPLNTAYGSLLDGYDIDSSGVNNTL